MPDHPDAYWLVADQIFDGARFCNDIALRIANGRIEQRQARAIAGSDGALVKNVTGTLCPGYIDVQINGGGGVLFNDDPTEAGLTRIGAAHRARGTLFWLPTFITDAHERMELAGDAILSTLGKAGVIGVHFEGPHIAPSRKGAHAERYIHAIDEPTFALFRRLRDANVPLLATLAPERQPKGAIARLVEMGVVVSIGHSAATAAEVKAALAEGARAFTHLHNAMTPMTSREAGVVGTALNSEAWCGFIADGIHVHWDVLALSIRARSWPERMVVVSDAMPTLNGPDYFHLYGERIDLKDGALVNGKGSLAGVHIDMAQSVRNLVAHVGLSREDALAMATANPAAMMRLEGKYGWIQPGAQAQFLVLNEALNIIEIIGNLLS